ncbi:SubName: Full=Uncharacterized protein {ECO:0000313/EMBL:CCA66765.1} [Serendipita indica DSM 11827]|nr:SubName: Full=Uncharacterized protein {ECO:0000313/EMBL:CCA66765.1} [Serendipita indica DSM 11827]
MATDPSNGLAPRFSVRDDDSSQAQKREMAGYKSVISNSKSTPEAKANAEKKLKQLMSDEKFEASDCFLPFYPFGIPLFRRGKSDSGFYCKYFAVIGGNLFALDSVLALDVALLNKAIDCTIGDRVHGREKNAAQEAKDEVFETVGDRVRARGRQSGPGSASANAASSYLSGDKNPKRIIAGLKASLRNPNTSDEKKEAIRQKLKSMGEKDIPEA